MTIENIEKQSYKLRSVRFLIDTANLLPMDFKVFDVIPIEQFRESDIHQWLAQFEEYPALIDHLTRDNLSGRNHLRTLFNALLQKRLLVDAIIDLGLFQRGKFTTAEISLWKGRYFYKGAGPYAKDETLFSRLGILDLPCELSSTPGKNLKKPCRLRIEPIVSVGSLQDLDPQRFRRCPVCGYAFYALRLDSTCCSKEHAVIFRQRKRRPNIDAVNEARRWKYRRNLNKNGDTK